MSQVHSIKLSQTSEEDAFMSSLFDQLDNELNPNPNPDPHPISTPSTSLIPISISNSTHNHKSIKKEKESSTTFPLTSFSNSQTRSAANPQARDQVDQLDKSKQMKKSKSLPTYEDQAAAEQMMFDVDFNLDDLELDFQIERGVKLDKGKGKERERKSSSNVNYALNNGRNRLNVSRKEVKKKEKNYQGWRLDDMSSEAQTARENSRASCRAYTRCIVKRVSSRRYTLNSNLSTSSTKPEKVLDLQVLEKIDKLEDSRSNPSSSANNSSTTSTTLDKGKGKEKKKMMRALLRGDWMQSTVKEGDILNLIGKSETILDVGFEEAREEQKASQKLTDRSRLEGSSSVNKEKTVGEGEEDLWASMDFQDDSELNSISLSQGIKPSVFSPQSPKASSTIASNKGLDEEDKLWEGLDDQDSDFQNLSTSQPSSSSSPRFKGRARILIETEPEVEVEKKPLLPVQTLILSVSKEHSGNLLILHPDVLIPATKLSDVASCMRRPLIQDRMRGAGSEAVGVGLVMGNLAHEVLQACLLGKGAEVIDQDRLSSAPVHNFDEKSHREMEGDNQKSLDEMNFPLEWPQSSIGDFSLPFIRAQVRYQIKKNLASLISCGITDTGNAVNSLMETIKGYGWFAKLYLDGDAETGQGFGKEMKVAGDSDVKEPFENTLSDEATVNDARATVPARIRLRRILDIEEDIWSPMYGLKGKVDVSVEVELIEQDEHLAKTGAIGAAFKRASTAQELSASIGSRSDLGNRAQTEMSRSEKRRKEKEDSEVKRVVVMPLELKTGRSVSGMEHRAQTMLYTLMMSDRYGTDVTSGLLYYSKINELHRVRRSLNEVRGLIMGRNEMAGYLIRRPPSSSSSSQVAHDGNLDSLAADIDNQLSLLPPTIDSERVCGRCYALDGCMLYRKAVDRIEEDEDEPSPIAQMYKDRTSHLTPQHLEFFQKWEALLTLEENDITRFRRELWIWTSKVREQAGRCFTEMVIESQSSAEGVEGQPAPKENRSMNVSSYRFVRSSNSSTQHGSSLLNGHMAKNDPVTISIEPGLLSVAQGFIVDLTPESVTVGLDHSLDSAIDRAMEQSGQEVSKERSNVVFRIDRDELSAGMGRIRLNLGRLFFSDSVEGRHQISDPRRRELIVDLRPPQFKISAELEEERGGPIELPDHLNQDQKAAMVKILLAQDYALILGMPGTGKTTTIAELIKLLARRGKSVLLASYTHSAVDTILRKLSNLNSTDGLNILRLGNADKVHKDVLPFVLGQGPKGQAETIEQLEDQLMSPNVVATTCLSIGHPIFSKRKFDYCIVDEASQITLPTCLGPLRFAERFVLVGDHFQLPPLVRNSDARKGGLDLSLFKILADKHPNSVVELTRQYRMNKEIMALSNHLIYDGKLKCGNQEVSELSLVLPKKEHVNQILHSSKGSEGCGSLASPFMDRNGTSESSSKVNPCWLENLLDESCKAVFVDTGALPAKESKVGDLVQNTVEANLVEQICKTFILGGVEGSEMAVITPYRQQIKLLTHLLHPTQIKSSSSQSSSDVKPLSDTSAIEIFTADRSQGRDKSIILISLVRSNDTSNVGDLLKDWRRINVAFTRAKKKLIVIGDRKTLKEAEMLNDFLGLMDRNGWTLKLKKGDELIHKGIGERVKKVEDDVKIKEEMEVDETVKENLEVPSTPQRKRKSASLSSLLSPSNHEPEESSGAVNLSPSSSAPIKRSRSSVGTLTSSQSQALPHGSVREAKKNTISKKALLSGRPVLKDLFREQGLMDEDEVCLM